MLCTRGFESLSCRHFAEQLLTENNFHFILEIKTYTTCDSRVVPHRSTEQAQWCLTSEFGWDPVVSPWYERTMLGSGVCDQHMDSNPIIVVVHGIIPLTTTDCPISHLCEACGIRTQVSLSTMGFESHKHSWWSITINPVQKSTMSWTMLFTSGSNPCVRWADHWKTWKR